MKTKIVYVLTSKDSDYYIEQTLISIVSLRHYNPVAHIILVMDMDTFGIIQDRRSEILNHINEIKPVQTPDMLSKMGASRYLKTSLRFIIEGDYLFIDGDTVICDDISSVDSFKCNIGAVIDKHLHIDRHKQKNSIFNKAKAVEWDTSNWDGKYYNSGVMLVKDNEETRRLYNNWHKEWVKYSEMNIYIDQPTLNKVNSQLGFVIEELPGEWNCQIVDNGIKYLHKAHIIHYFASTIYGSVNDEFAYKFKSKSLYEDIKIHGITTQLENWIEHPKEMFADKISLICDDNCDFFSSPIARISKRIYRNLPWINKLLSKIIN